MYIQIQYNREKQTDFVGWFVVLQKRNKKKQKCVTLVIFICKYPSKGPYIKFIEKHSNVISAAITIREILKCDVLLNKRVFFEDVSKSKSRVAGTWYDLTILLPSCGYRARCEVVMNGYGLTETYDISN